jgi:hypothetical protein
MDLRLKKVLEILKEIEFEYDDHDITHKVGDIDYLLHDIDELMAEYDEQD